jgi:hypothetical protein
VPSLDPYGDRLLCTQTSGDHWRTQHDQIKHKLAEIIRRAGGRAQEESTSLVKDVLARHPEYIAPLSANGGTRKLTIDIAASFQGPRGGPPETYMIEVKCVHPGNSRYLPNATVARAAVNRRAAQTRTERERGFERYDNMLQLPQGVQLGPFRSALAALPTGGVVGVASCAHVEWSTSVDALLQRAAQAGAPRWMDRLGAPTLEDTAKTLLHLWRQELGMCVLQANSHLLLSRVRQAFQANLHARAPPEQAPVGAGPEGGSSAFARWADFAYWRSDPLTGFYLRSDRAERRPGVHASRRRRQ